MKTIKWGEKVIATNRAVKGCVLKKGDLGICLGYRSLGHIVVVKEGQITASSYSKYFWEISKIKE